MGRMIRLVEQGYTDGIAYVEEVYKILRGKGYAPDEILKLFALKRALQLALEEGGEAEVSPEAEKILDRLARIVR
ncbi:MAG: hypothetical protein DRH20_03390 [Deltaproteobacteria bacterium]|nr:MAG: hypothetical protein DRH20_03390 [Deltaproteobacteria bacterium]